MELLGGNAHFAPQSEFPPVGEPGGRVDIHRRAVHVGGKIPLRLRAPGHDGLAVAGGVRRDVGDRLLHILHALDSKNVIQKFRIKIFLPRLFPGDDGSRRLIQTKLHCPFPVSDQTFIEHGQKRGGDRLVHQQDFLGVADAGAAGFGVFHNVQRHVQVGGLLHIYVADAGAGGDAGHGGGAYAGIDQPRAATWDQQVNVAVCGHQRRGAFPGGILHQIHRILRNPHRFKTGTEGVNDGVGAAERLLSASQDADVPAFQRQSGGIAGDVGTAFVNNGNDTHGDGHLLNFQTVLADVGLQNPPHRVGQRRHLTAAFGNARNALFVQHQTVDQAVVQTCRSAVFNINPVCRDDLVRMCHQRVRNGENAAVFVVRAELRHRVLGAAGVLGDF